MGSRLAASESGSERYSNRPPQEQRIRRLYQEAKHIQGKLFKTLKKGEEVQVAELEAIAANRRILVCWCGWQKPCHACIVAEFAVGFLAITAVTAACGSSAA